MFRSRLSSVRLDELPNRKKRGFLGGCIATVALLAMMATTVATAGRAGSASIQTIKHSVIQGPWLVWDKSSCSFKTAPSKTTSYTSVLRKAPSGFSLAFTPETTTLAFDLIMNKSITDAAKAAGIPIKLLDTQFPSKSVPIDVANTVVQLKPTVVLSGLVVGSLYPAIQAKYFGACLPFVDQFAMPTPKPVPQFQTQPKNDGIMMGNAAVTIAKQRHFPVSQTWVVTCTDSTVTSTPGSIYDIGTYFNKTVAAGLHIPASQVVPLIECPSGSGPPAHASRCGTG